LSDASRDRWSAAGSMRSVADSRGENDPVAAIALLYGAMQLEQADHEISHGRVTREVTA
jgi:hypothetical protein